MTLDQPENLRTLKFLADYRREIGFEQALRFEESLGSTFEGSWPFIGGGFGIIVEGQWRVTQLANVEKARRENLGKKIAAEKDSARIAELEKQLAEGGIEYGTAPVPPTRLIEWIRDLQASRQRSEHLNPSGRRIRGPRRPHRSGPAPAPERLRRTAGLPTGRSLWPSLGVSASAANVLRHDRSSQRLIAGDQLLEVRPRVDPELEGAPGPRKLQELDSLQLLGNRVLEHLPPPPGRVDPPLV